MVAAAVIQERLKAPKGRMLDVEEVTPINLPIYESVNHCRKPAPVGIEGMKEGTTF